MKIIDWEFLFFYFILWSKEEEPILVLDDSIQIFEIEQDYSLCLEDSGSKTNAEVGISLGYKLLSHTSCTISKYQKM